MKLIIKHCPPWGSVCTNIIYLDTNDTVDTLQDIITKKFGIAKQKQILKFKRDGITVNFLEIFF